jgi:peptidoglycan/xylan/chitin deacetylase (PgdA/CDA1 family)
MIDPRRPLVVMYHYVWPDAEPIPGGIRPMRVVAFESQLDQLTSRYDIVEADDFLARLDETSNRPPCLLTFDDGTRDHATVVTPILARRGLSGVFFIVSDAARGVMMPTTHLVHWLLGNDDEAVWANLQRACDPQILGDPKEAARIYHYESPTRGRIKYALNMAMPADVARAAALALLATASKDERALAREWFAQADQLRAMHDAGMTLALHGRTHASLQQMGESVAGEIEECAALLRSITGESPRWWACPFGGTGASAEAHLAMRSALTRANVRAGVSTESGSVPTGCDPLAIPRVDCVSGLLTSLLK